MNGQMLIKPDALAVTGSRQFTCASTGPRRTRTRSCQSPLAGRFTVAAYSSLFVARFRVARISRLVASSPVPTALICVPSGVQNISRPATSAPGGETNCSPTSASSNASPVSLDCTSTLTSTGPACGAAGVANTVTKNGPDDSRHSAAPPSAKAGRVLAIVVTSTTRPTAVFHGRGKFIVIVRWRRPSRASAWVELKSICPLETILPPMRPMA